MWGRSQERLVWRMTFMEDASQGQREAQGECSKLRELLMQRSLAQRDVQQVTNVQMPHVLMWIMNEWDWRVGNSPTLQAMLIFSSFFLRKKKYKAIRFWTILCRKWICIGQICIEKIKYCTDRVSHWKVIVAWLDIRKYEEEFKSEMDKTGWWLGCPGWKELSGLMLDF